MAERFIRRMVIYTCAVVAGVTAAQGNWILVWAFIAIYACRWIVLGDEPPR